MRTALFAFLIIVIAPSLAYSGGVLDVLIYERKPLLQSNKGVITGCGVHFSGIVSNHQSLYGIQGSYNIVFFADEYPGLIYKMVVVSPSSDGSSFEHKKVAFAYLRTNLLSTAEWGELENGRPEYASYFKPKKLEDVQKIMDSMYEVPFDEGWMGFNINDGQDYTFRVPKINNENMKLYSVILDCLQLGLKQTIERLEQ